jgi:hypothetical protein
MDYNLPIMTASQDIRARRRLTLIAITLATIPCYCIGWVALALAPDPNQLTPTITETGTPTITPIGTLATSTITVTPLNLYPHANTYTVAYVLAYLHSIVDVYSHPNQPADDHFYALLYTSTYIYPYAIHYPIPITHHPRPLI